MKEWYKYSARGILLDWYDRSQDAGKADLFVGFISLWIAFEIWGITESDKLNDQEMIKWAKTSDMRKIFRDIRPQLESSLQALHKMGKIPNHLTQGATELHDPHDFDKLLEVLYQIRNNLIHGHKSASDFEDRRFVELAFDILSPLIKPLVDDIRMPKTRYG